jgi:hypothetical protein
MSDRVPISLFGDYEVLANMPRLHVFTMAALIGLLANERTNSYRNWGQSQITAERAVDIALATLAAIDKQEQ